MSIFVAIAKEHQAKSTRGNKNTIWSLDYFRYQAAMLFIYLLIYKIRHQQNKDKIDNIKNTKAGAVHREELQLRDPNINRTQHNTHYNSTTHI